MSTWKSSEVFNTVSGKKTTCQICGNEPDTTWSRNEDIIICSRCAFDILPKIMADAVANRLLNHPIPKDLQISAFKAMWKEAEKNYWYAAACQLLQAIKRENQSHDHN